MQPFRKLDVYASVSAYTTIFWELAREFNVSGVCTFEVYRSKTGISDWEHVATVENTYYAIDTERALYGKSLPIAYFVVLTDSNGDRYPSPVKYAVGNMQGSEHIAAMIVADERKMLDSFTGTCGYLLKRKVWGTKCPVCLDYSLEESANSNCSTCFGTGFVGGYFSPYAYPIAITAVSPIQKDTTDSIGTVASKTLTGRGLVCPWLMPKDIWVNGHTGDRYEIKLIEPTIFRGMPIIYGKIQMDLIEKTAKIYEISIND